jgi:hypothetical protein
MPNTRKRVGQNPGRRMMRQISRHTVLGIMALAAGIAVVDGDTAWRPARTQAITGMDARVIR